MANGSRKPRNYRLEYKARLARGRARGESLAQARGHARAIDISSSATSSPVDKESKLERALALMKLGYSQKKAAKFVGISAEKLRQYQQLNTTSTREGQRWVIIDQRPITLALATRGKIRNVTVLRTIGSEVGRYWVAVNKYLETNKPVHLQEFVGQGVRDQAGVFHPFETRPNVLRKLDSIGELAFVDIYRSTVQ